MYRTSYEYQVNANADYRRIQAKVEVTAQADLTEDNIIEFELKESVCDKAVSIGTANSQVFELKCRANGYTFQGMHLTPFIGFNGEWCPLGSFIVSDVELTDGVYKITAYDKMAYLDEGYTPFVTLPATCGAVITDIAEKTGFMVDSNVTYPDGKLVTHLPENCTYRQMIGYVAGLMGKNARFDRDGKLTFTWFRQLTDIYGDVNEDNRVTTADLNIIESELIGTTTREDYEAILGRLFVGTARVGAVIKEKSFMADVNGDLMVTADDVNEIRAYINGAPYPETRVGHIEAYREEIPSTRYYMNELTDTGTFTFTALISGTKDEPVESGSGRAISFSNPFMTQTRLHLLRGELMPFTYDSGEVTFIGNPAFEVGDIVRVDGRDFPIMAQEIKYDGGLKAEISAFGISEEKQMATKSVPSLIESIQSIGLLENRVAEINADLNNAQGFFGGTYKELYGTDIDPSALSGLPIGWRVINNNDPTKWWQMTYNGLGYTENNGVSYKIGITNTGKIYADNIVANAILTNHITAENLDITGGKLSIETQDDSYDAIHLKWRDSFVQVTPTVVRVSDGDILGTGTDLSAGGIITKNENGDIVARLTYDSLYSGYTVGNNLHVPNNIYEGAVTLSNKYAQISGATFTGTVNIGTSSTGQSLYMYGPSFLKYAYPFTSSQTAVVMNASGQLGYVSSSRRYKKNIEDVSDASLDPYKLYDLPVRQYVYRDNFADDDTRGLLQIGLIAEEVEQIYPAAAAYRNGKVETWNERNFIPAMLKLIQEQHTEIESLKEAVNGLKE